MMTRLQKWGNSQGIRLNKDLLREVQLKVGDEVKVSVYEGQILIEPITQIRGKYSLEDLVHQIPADYQSTEVNWGENQGKEEW